MNTVVAVNGNEKAMIIGVLTLDSLLKYVCVFLLLRFSYL